MNQLRLNDIRWPAVAIGWVAAVLSLIVLGLVFGAIFGVVDPDSGAGAALGGVVISLVTGFAAYGIGGYVAARRARVNGPLNGAMVAVFGIVVGILLAIVVAILGILAGLIFSGGQVSGIQGLSAFEGVGLASGGILAAIAVLIVNVLGGYVGGTIAGPADNSGSGASRPSRVR